MVCVPIKICANFSIFSNPFMASNISAAVYNLQNNSCWFPLMAPRAYFPHCFVPPSTAAGHQNEEKLGVKKVAGQVSGGQEEMPHAVDEDIVDRIGESARNRYGRPYISGRPLLLCDRKKIIRLYREGRRKIMIAREIGVTHSCVSKVIRRYEETGELENKNSRTASCACPGEAENHDLRVCRHVRFNRFRAEHQNEEPIAIGGGQQRQQQRPKREQPHQQQPANKNEEPRKFSIEWILSIN